MIYYRRNPVVFCFVIRYLCKKPFFAGPVCTHIPVIVQMILGQIGKDQKIESAVANPVKVDGVGRNFHNHMGDPAFEHFSQNFLQIVRFRRCHGVLKRFTGISVS